MYDSSMVTTDRHFTRNHSLDPSRPALLLIDVQPRRAEARMNCPHWLLALAIPFSRSDRAHTSTADVGAGCSEGLFRTDCSAGKSPSAAGRPWGVIPTGGSLYQARAGPSTHFVRSGRRSRQYCRAPARSWIPPPEESLSATRFPRPPPRIARVPRSPPVCRSASPAPDAPVAASRRRPA